MDGKHVRPLCKEEVLLKGDLEPFQTYDAWFPDEERYHECEFEEFTSRDTCVIAYSGYDELHELPLAYLRHVGQGDPAPKPAATVAREADETDDEEGSVPDGSDEGGDEHEHDLAEAEAEAAAAAEAAEEAEDFLNAMSGEQPVSPTSTRSPEKEKQKGKKEKKKGKKGKNLDKGASKKGAAAPDEKEETEQSEEGADKTGAGMGAGTGATASKSKGKSKKAKAKATTAAPAPVELVKSTSLPKKADELCEVMLEGTWYPGLTLSVPKSKKKGEFRVQLLELDEHVEAFNVTKDQIRCLPTRPGHEDDELQMDRKYTALFPEDGTYHSVVVKGLTDRGTCVVVYAGYEEDMHELPLVYLQQVDGAASGDDDEEEDEEEDEDNVFAGLGDGLEADEEEEEEEEEEDGGALEDLGGVIGADEPHSSLAGSPFGLEKITEGEAEAEMDTVDDVTTTTPPTTTNNAGKSSGAKGKASKREAEKEARERKTTEAAAAVKVRARIRSSK